MRRLPIILACLMLAGCASDYEYYDWRQIGRADGFADSTQALISIPEGGRPDMKTYWEIAHPWLQNRMTRYRDWMDSASQVTYTYGYRKGWGEALDYFYQKQLE